VGEGVGAGVKEAATGLGVETAGEDVGFAAVGDGEAVVGDEAVGDVTGAEEGPTPAVKGSDIETPAIAEGTHPVLLLPQPLLGGMN